MIKDDPLKAMQLEERKEKFVPSAMQPDGPTLKLQAKLKDTLKKGANEKKTKSGQRNSNR